MIELNAQVLIQGLGAVLLTVIWWNLRRLIADVDRLKNSQTLNTNRLVRIETRLNIGEPMNHDIA